MILMSKLTAAYAAVIISIQKSLTKLSQKHKTVQLFTPTVYNNHQTTEINIQQ